MKLSVKPFSQNETHFIHRDISPGEGWYEVEREPDLVTEQLRYDPETDSVLIEQRTPTSEQIAAEQKSSEDALLTSADSIRTLKIALENLQARIAILESSKEP